METWISFLVIWCSLTQVSFTPGKYMFLGVEGQKKGRWYIKKKKKHTKNRNRNNGKLSLALSFNGSL